MANSTNPGHETLQEALDRVVAGGEIPGIVAEVRDENGSWFGSAGVADLGSGRPRQPGEYVHTGSAGKAFTAAAALTLEAEGRLSLGDPVNTWLPGLLDVDANGYDGDRITIGHLLGNSSGLFATGIAPETSHRYATRANFDTYRYDVWSIEDLLKLAVSQPPVFQPGDGFMYSNGGFYIAAAIIEKVTGRSYADEVHRTVIEPLGLTATYVRPFQETVFPDPHPTAYAKLFYKDGTDLEAITPENWQSLMEDPDLEPLDVTEHNTSWGWSAGNVVSTTSDMIRFVGAIIGGGLLPPEQHRKMWTTISTEGAHWMPNSRYGLGAFEFEKATTGDLTLRGVGGSLHGSFIGVVGTADGEHTVAFHTNTEWKSWEHMFAILRAEFGVPFAADQTP